MRKDSKLSVSVTGIELRHPVMNASGILGDSVEGIRRLIGSGVSAVVTKTLTLEPREGYLPPILVPLEYGLLNAVGLANPGIDYVETLVREAHSSGLPIVVSIGGMDSDEFHVLAVKAFESGADALELNLSCPHTPGYGVDTASTLSTLKAVADSVKSVTTKPVWAKLGYSRSILDEAGALLEKGIDALVLINTIPGMSIDVYARKPILTNRYGGLSGPAIHPVAVYTVYTVYREYRTHIVGAGGVLDWVSALELILAGARAVQVGTGFYVKGLRVVEEILDGIREYMDKTGAKSLEELVGSAVD